MDSDKLIDTQSVEKTVVGNHNDGKAVCGEYVINTEEEDGQNDAHDTDNTDEENEEDEEDEEPKLKYTRLTAQLGPVYRNGDATSAFLVAGDKMFIGTHNGNIHIVSLPSYQPLRVYHAHSASISSISVSPIPPLNLRPAAEGISKLASHVLSRPTTFSSDTPTGSLRKVQTIPIVQNIPSNAIYIATSSIDGKVCVQSLIDAKDVQLRSFGRPVHAVALSPEYKTDKTYISGGTAGNLVLTVGGKSGTTTVSTTTSTGTGVAATSGWLGAIRLSGNSGKENILHSGEGIISTIKWSLTGKYVAWTNEHGVKIMRSNLHLDNTDNELAWRRIGHVDRPTDDNREGMASVWKARVEWIDLNSLQANEGDKPRETEIGSPSRKIKIKSQKPKMITKLEKLLVGWGGTVWIIDIHPEDSVGVNSDIRNRSVGRPEIVKILNLECIISGVSLYSPTLLIVLAYTYPSEDEGLPEKASKMQIVEESTDPAKPKPRGGIRRRIKALPPELCLIDITSSEEIDAETLSVGRYDRLSASDYHLGIIPAVNNISIPHSNWGTFETLTGVGSGMWNATKNATSILNSSASIRSTESKTSNSSKQTISRVKSKKLAVTHRPASNLGLKIFIHSPYDCILAIKRDLSDHLEWLIERNKYKDAWELLEEHPEIISSTEKFADDPPELSETRHDDFYDDSSVISKTDKTINFVVEREKSRVGELWIQQLIKMNDWAAAGRVCAKVLRTAQHWENYITKFISSSKIDEIIDYIPSKKLQPTIKPEIYEKILGHYIARNRPKAKILLETWSTDLFNIRNITNILENQLQFRDVRKDSIEDGEVGRDWRIVMEALGRLYTADGCLRDSLKCYIELQYAEIAMNLIKEHHLIDVLSEDIPGVILLRVSQEQIETATIPELKNATSEAISLLVNEALNGLISPSIVVQQLQERNMILYLYFYISALWTGEGIEEYQSDTRGKLVQDTKLFVDQFADLAVHLFANYDRELLMVFLKSSTSYTFEMATNECEERDYIPELVYLYSKTGQTKRALYLIIGRLADVSQAISFAKEQNDSDLWEDLLNYSMDKPSFIRGLLEEVGTAINPITLIRRIPEGLKIDGLREGLKRIIKEHELQHSISLGVAKVLRGEVAMAQNTLRSGQQKGVRFDVVRKQIDDVDVETSHISAPISGANIHITKNYVDNNPTSSLSKPGYCVGCHKPFTDCEVEIVVGFVCGHIWHISHLLSILNKNQPFTPAQIELNQCVEWTPTNSVGAKVTHARLLRDNLRTGCPICKSEEKFN